MSNSDESPGKAGGLPKGNYPNGFAMFNGPFDNKDVGIETAIQSDGRIIVMGYTYDGSKNNALLLRYNTDGTLDDTFGTNGYVIFDGGGMDQKGLGLALSQDGVIIVTGYFKVVKWGRTKLSI